MDFKIFEDKELTKPIEAPIDLGKLKAGEEKEYIYYVFNASVHPYEELEFSVDHKEVTVISSPTEMEEKTRVHISIDRELMDEFRKRLIRKHGDISLYIEKWMKEWVKEK